MSTPRVLLLEPDDEDEEAEGTVAVAEDENKPVGEDRGWDEAFAVGQDGELDGTGGEIF